VPNKPSSLERLLKALRLKKADLELCDHGRSCLWVKEKKIFFSSGIDSLKDALISEFPKQHTLLEDFFAHLVIYNEFAPEVGSPSVESARAILKEKLKDTTLVELLLFPVLTYGSATPQDMPYQLFACLFKSMFFEGMGRPKRGIRALYTPILDKLKANGVERGLSSFVKRGTFLENLKNIFICRIFSH
jgi:phytoene dehydrogenase-like protein